MIKSELFEMQLTQHGGRNIATDAAAALKDAYKKFATQTSMVIAQRMAADYTRKKKAFEASKTQYRKTGSLDALAGRYDMVNIKLDKTGGLTEALALRAEAEARGFAIMVGCMVGSSLAMAPAVLVAQGSAYVDLDGPLLLAEDREHPLVFDEAGIHPPSAALWG